jgi:hypothetical protein
MFIINGYAKSTLVQDPNPGLAVSIRPVKYCIREHLFRKMVDDEYKTIPSPNWALGSRTEGHYTDTTARYVKRMRKVVFVLHFLKDGWGGHVNTKQRKLFHCR